jgi:hypothetical protein
MALDLNTIVDNDGPLHYFPPFRFLPVVCLSSELIEEILTHLPRLVTTPYEYEQVSIPRNSFEGLVAGLTFAYCTPSCHSSNLCDTDMLHHSVWLEGESRA